MLNSKQRSVLKAISQNIEPIAQVGKNGITENLTESISQALEAREIVKVTVLRNAEADAQDIANELADGLTAEVVCVVGKKITLYRKSLRADVKHIAFPPEKNSR